MSYMEYLVRQWVAFDAIESVVENIAVKEKKYISQLLGVFKKSNLFRQLAVEDQKKIGEIVDFAQNKVD